MDDALDQIKNIQTLLDALVTDDTATLVALKLAAAKARHALQQAIWEAGGPGE